MRRNVPRTLLAGRRPCVQMTCTFGAAEGLCCSLCRQSCVARPCASHPPLCGLLRVPARHCVAAACPLHALQLHASPPSFFSWSHSFFLEPLPAWLCRAHSCSASCRPCDLAVSWLHACLMHPSLHCSAVPSFFLLAFRSIQSTGQRSSWDLCWIRFSTP